MTDIILKPGAQDQIKVERPRLHKVILVNDDFTPRDFVVTVLKAEFPALCINRHYMMVLYFSSISEMMRGNVGFAGIVYGTTLSAFCRGALAQSGQGDADVRSGRGERVRPPALATDRWQTGLPALWVPGLL
jgi:ATP-dependent Clp protease adaptor protein ClpS